MAHRRTDRRVRRTRSRLKEALLELLAVKRYEGITIRDITQRADVGRSTFYSHYDSKEDLLFSGFDEWLRSLPGVRPAGDARGEGDECDERAPAPDARFRFSLPLLRHVRSQERFFRNIMIGGSSVRVRRKATALLAEVVGLELERLAGAGGSHGRAGAGGTRRNAIVSARGRRGGPGGPGRAGGPGGPGGPAGPGGRDDPAGAANARAHALAGAWVGLVAWWLEDEKGYEAEDVDRIYQEIVRHGVIASPAAASGASLPDRSA